MIGKGVRHRRRPYRDYEDDDPDSIGETLAAVNDRLDDLARQIARIARRSHAEEREIPSTLEEALAHFDRRLDEIVDSERASRASHFRAGDARPRHADWPQDYAQAATEHSRMPQPAPMPEPAPNARVSAPPSAPAELTVDLSGLENHLRQITEQIADLHQPCRIDDAVGALRSDLAEIGRAVNDAMPRNEIGALEQQVRVLAEHVDRSRDNGANIAKLAQLEHGLAEVRDALRNQMPTENLVAVNAAVKDLTHRVEQLGASNQTPAALHKLDQVMAGLRAIGSHAASNDTVGKLAEEVRSLSARANQVMAESAASANNDNPAALQKLEQAVTDLHIMVSHSASNETVGMLVDEVRGLSERFEQSTAESTGNTLSNIERQITTLNQGSINAPAELKALVLSLGEQINHAQHSHAQLSQGDKLALSSIEDRIVKLAGKLDTSDAWLARLGAIERGMADVLMYLEAQRRLEAQRILEVQRRLEAQRRAMAQGPAPEPRQEPRQEIQQNFQQEMRQDGREEPRHDLREEPHEELYTAMARAEPELRSEPEAVAVEATQTAVAEAAASAPTATQVTAPEQVISTETITAPPSSSATPVFTPTPTAAFTLTQNKSQLTPLDALSVAASDLKAESYPVRRPINPNLPPDTPIEPSPETAPMRASAADRIAASEEALGGPKPAGREVASQFETLIAARRAAFVAGAEAEPEAAPFKPTFPRPEAKGGRRIGGYLRWLLLAASVVIILLGAMRVAMEMWHLPEPAVAPTAPTPSNLPAPPAPSATSQPDAAPDTGQQNPVMPMPAPEAAPEPPQKDPASVPQGATPNSLPAPTPNAPSNDGNSKPDPLGDAGSKTMPEVTGALARQEQDARSTTQPALPVTIGGPALRAAATAGNPSAEYEVAVRYAEGRGVTANIEEAARWLERAAKSGFAPAQFRLGGLYDKGGGLKKDRALARLLYSAAAEKGHAKAMHNLAVLYAEGIDGKPNYRAAAQLFRKASDYGIADSQYNLAILFVRGIGVEQNLAEAYKWFALAANQGDQEAGRKRDEVAERLDPQSLNAAQISVQVFQAAQQPELAVSLRAPPGGWDRANATVQPQRQRLGPTEPALPKSLLSPAPL